MNIWRLTTMDLHELSRRLRAGETRAAISRAMQISVNTVKDYRRWAQAQGLLTDALPDLATLEGLRQRTFHPRRERHPTEFRLESFRPQITALTQQGFKPRAIWQRLCRKYAGLAGSESAVWRLVKDIKGHQPPEVVMRIETAPGEVAQVDFGYLGYVFDPEQNAPRKAWAFVMTLGWSRHQYAEIVFDQTMASWLLCHQHAFEFFGGVPKRMVLDNLKAAIIRAYTVDADPQVQQSYRECADHYGFLIDPCWPRKPQHKGKVERGGVAYLKQSFAPLLTAEDTLVSANQKLRHWLLTTAGLRVHGTTQAVPLSRFEHTERAALLPLPTTAYDPALWKECKLHRDGHVTFEKSYYSAPHRFIGQTLWLRAGLGEIRLFSSQFELLATHPRARQPGQRLTQADHLPPSKVQALTFSRETCQAQAQAIGPATQQVTAERTVYDRPLHCIAVRCRKKNGQWGIGVLLSTLAPADVLTLTGQPVERAHDPTGVLLAYVYFYDQRGGGIEVEIKEDKQGLRTTKRNKKRFAAQRGHNPLATSAARRSQSDRFVNTESRQQARNDNGVECMNFDP
jgi:transposase